MWCCYGCGVFFQELAFQEQENEDGDIEGCCPDCGSIDIEEVGE
jgi:hypothetical protein